MKTRVGIILLLVLATGCGSKKDDEKMQGTWSMTSYLKEGDEVEADRTSKMVVVIKGESIAIRMERKDREETGRFKLDPSKKPKEIDLDDGKGSSKKDGDKEGVRKYEIPGIYEIDG